MSSDDGLKIDNLSDIPPTSKTGPGCAKIVLFLFLLLIAIGGIGFALIKYLPDTVKLPDMKKFTAMLKTSRSSGTAMPNKTEEIASTGEPMISSDPSTTETNSAAQPTESTPPPLSADEKIIATYRIDGLAKGANQTVAIINGAVVYEGQEISGGAVIETIENAYVILNIDGQRYRLRQ